MTGPILWFGFPVRLTYDPALIRRFARLTAPWRRSRALLTPAGPGRLTVTIIEGTTHART